MNIKDLQIITNDTLKEVRKHDIVTPDFFTDTFYDKAIKIESNLERDDVTKHSMNTILDKVLHIQKENKEHTNNLKENIDLATVAIDAHDNKSLAEVKDNIAILYQRILDLEEQVYIDDLTKVQNRKWLFEKVLENNHFKEDGTLTFVDIDKFKVINDNYGHLAGDKVLFMIAKLTTHLADSKTVRYGGDEFITLSKNLDKDEHQKFFTTINQNLAKKALNYQNHSFKVGISFGTINYKVGDSFQEVIDKVDKLMYQHKKVRVELAV